MCRVKIGKFPKHFSLFFKKTHIKTCFESLILDFELRLKTPTFLRNSEFVCLYLNGFNIVVVINSWLKQIVIYLTKRLMLNIIVPSKMRCSQWIKVSCLYQFMYKKKHIIEC